MHAASRHAQHLMRSTHERVLQAGVLAGLAAAYLALHWELSQLLAVVAGLGFLVTFDQVGMVLRSSIALCRPRWRCTASAEHVREQVANGGGLEALAVDTAGRYISSTYADRVAAHEAGHLLIAYLVGIVPRTYTLSSLDAFRR